MMTPNPPAPEHPLPEHPLAALPLMIVAAQHYGNFQPPPPKVAAACPSQRKKRPRQKSAVEKLVDGMSNWQRNKWRRATRGLKRQDALARAGHFAQLQRPQRPKKRIAA